MDAVWGTSANNNGNLNVQQHETDNLLELQQIANRLRLLNGKWIKRGLSTTAEEEEGEYGNGNLNRKAKKETE